MEVKVNEFLIIHNKLSGFFYSDLLPRNFQHKPPRFHTILLLTYLRTLVYYGISSVVSLIGCPLKKLRVFGKPFSITGLQRLAKTSTCRSQGGL